MAQITAGIKVLFGTGSGTGGNTPPTTWTEFPDITSTPALSVEPGTIDVTTLAETEMKVYIESLKDMGGALAFEGWYTPELIAAVDAALLVDPEKLWLCVAYPAPVAKRVQWKGTVAECLPGEAGVDGALPTTLYITPNTEMDTVDLVAS